MEMEMGMEMVCEVPPPNPVPDWVRIHREIPPGTFLTQIVLASTYRSEEEYNMLLSTVSNNTRTSYNPYSCPIRRGDRYLGDSGIDRLLPITLSPHPEEQQTPRSLPFQFSCNLTEHPLFRLPRLVQLMQSIARYSPDKVTCVATKEKSKQSSGSECIRQEYFSEIAALAKETGLLILISEVERDPEYRLFLDGIMEALAAASEKNTNSHSAWMDAYISMTPSSSEYILGDELNFLFRVGRSHKYSINERPSIFISFVSLPKVDWKAKLHIFALESLNI
jgi:hypothetical protein